MSVRISRVRMATNGTSHEHIADLEWISDSSGKTGHSSRQAMYDWIKNQSGQAYVRDKSNNTVEVYARQNSHGTEYVQTAADGVWTDNLLALPRY